MDCKNKYYADGEYTLCGECKKAEACKAAKRCFHCGSVRGVAYERRWDVFSCVDCLKRLEK